MVNMAAVTGAFAIWSGVFAVEPFAVGLISAWQAGRLVQVDSGPLHEPTNWDSAISVTLIFAACGVAWSYLTLVLWLVSLANPGFVSSAQLITHGAGWYLPLMILIAEGLATFMVTRYALEVPAPYVPLAASGQTPPRASRGDAGDVDVSAAVIIVLVVLVVIALSAGALTVWLVIRASSSRRGIALGFRTAFGFGYFRPRLATGLPSP